MKHYNWHGNGALLKLLDEFLDMSSGDDSSVIQYTTAVQLHRVAPKRVEQLDAEQRKLLHETDLCGDWQDVSLSDEEPPVPGMKDMPFNYGVSR